MASRELEGPQLGLKTYRTTPGNWLAKGLSTTSRILTIAPEGEDPFWPSNVDNTVWQVFDGIDIDEPDASYDIVYLTNVLDRLSTEDQKKYIQEAARVTKNNGRVVAYSPACDDSEEAYELAKGYGVSTKDFLSRRLSNKDIARLKPHNAAFFMGKIVVPTRARLVTVLNELGLKVTLEHTWAFRDRFAIKRFHIGMEWFVERD